MKLLETMLIKNHYIENYHLHKKRFENSFKYFKWKQQKFIENRQFTQKDAKLRVIYSSKGIEKIEIAPLQKREFKSFQIKKIDFNYHLKYLNRTYLQTDKYEFILIKNNLVTDTTIANIAFFDGKEWLTPKYPLLKGTKREELLQKKLLKETNIHTSDIRYFQKIALLNSILGFFIIDNFDIIS